MSESGKPPEPGEGDLAASPAAEPSDLRGEVDLPAAATEAMVEPENQPTASAAGRGYAPQLSFAEVFVRALSVLAQNAVPFLAIAAVAFLPYVVYSWSVFDHFQTIMDSAAGADADAFFRVAVLWFVVSALYAMLVPQVVTGAVMYGTFQDLRGHRANVVACFTTGFRRLLGGLPTVIVTMLCVGLGMVACVIPGVLVLCVWFVAVPVAVVERKGVLVALRRSSELTEGHRLTIFAIAAVLYGTNWIAEKALQVLLLDIRSGQVPHLDQLRIYSLVSLGWSWLFVALCATVTAVTYFELRRIKERGTGTGSRFHFLARGEGTEDRS